MQDCNLKGLNWENEAWNHFSYLVYLVVTKWAEGVTDPKELQAFVRTFGGYGIDRLDRIIKERTAALLKCIDTSLRANRESLEAVLGFGINPFLNLIPSK